MFLLGSIFGFGLGVLIMLVWFASVPVRRPQNRGV